MTGAATAVPSRAVSAEALYALTLPQFSRFKLQRFMECLESHSNMHRPILNACLSSGPCSHQEVWKQKGWKRNCVHQVAGKWRSVIMLEKGGVRDSLLLSATATSVRS